MRPLEGYFALVIEFLEQVLDERANGIHAAGHGMQPEAVSRARIVRLRLELPVFDRVHKAFGEVAGN